MAEFIEKLVASLDPNWRPDPRHLGASGFVFALHGDSFSDEDAQALLGVLRPLGILPTRAAWAAFGSQFEIGQVAVPDKMTDCYKKHFAFYNLIEFGDAMLVFIPDEHSHAFYLCAKSLATGPLAAFVQACDRQYVDWINGAHHNAQGRAFFEELWRTYCAPRLPPG